MVTVFVLNMIPVRSTESLLALLETTERGPNEGRWFATGIHSGKTFANRAGTPLVATLALASCVVFCR